jgi:chromosome segregation protein
LEQIGGIDPLVVKEYAETQERFNFLTKESADLEKAILTLKEVIAEMEQKIDKIFATAFEEINSEFTKYFRIIFGGGNAYLSKVKSQPKAGPPLADKVITEEDSENSSEENGEITEAGEKEEVGVEIFACPPGKRINNLSMLSGGERSLTSLALLFAIISYNPPPFAVLDEVEAALDEANSRRFGKIITELSENTQFVIITHNRETMRQANLLYGVTMGDEGISKLLSVRLDQVGQGGKILK